MSPSFPRACFALAACVVTCACTKPSAPEATKDPAPSVSSPPSSPPAPLTAAAPSSNAKCAPLPWDADHANVASAVYAGKLDEVLGGLPNGSEEKFFVVALDRPVCGSSGDPVDEIQVYSETNDFAKAMGKHVRVTGEGFQAMTAHHHRDVVVEVKNWVEE